MIVTTALYLIVGLLAAVAVSAGLAVAYWRASMYLHLAAVLYESGLTEEGDQAADHGQRIAARAEAFVRLWPLSRMPDRLT
jgi:hypothetical protein